MVAFVAGIGNYNILGKLRNPVPDAKKMAKFLKTKNVEIYSAYDCGIEDLKEKFALFVAAVRPGDAVFMYFACHAAIFDNSLRLMAISNSKTHDIKADSLSKEQLVAWSATQTRTSCASHSQHPCTQHSSHGLPQCL